MTQYTFGPDVQFDPAVLNDIYHRAFGYKTNGEFVEVGGYDGKSYSHTWGLAELGWRGVYVEPVPRLWAQCNLNHVGHERISSLNCAAGAENGDVEIHIDDNCCCGSTMNRSICKNPQTFKAEMRTLDDILFEEDISVGFDLLSIDVEFAECEVLKGFKLSHWKPKLVIIELCEYHDEPKRSWAQPARDMCQRLFPPLSYSRVHEDAINTVFLKHA